MSEALARILESARAFSEGVIRCRRTVRFNAADVQDAYNRLSRLRDRYLHEKQKRTLDPIEVQALQKVFEDDPFIKGMLDCRQIGEHVQKKSGGDAVVRLTTNIPITLNIETSAGSFFAASMSMVRDAQGKVYFVDHLKQLEEAERRLKRALEHGRSS